MNWTSVTESIPEAQEGNIYGYKTSKEVLICTRYNSIKTAYVMIDIEDEHLKWVSACSEGWDITKEVTHWMPLPEPPK